MDRRSLRTRLRDGAVLDCPLGYSNAGRLANSSRGTPSTGKPAFTQARNPPLMTVTCTPLPCSIFCSSRATRVLVA
jgi:hypothetical protein